MTRKLLVLEADGSLLRCAIARRTRAGETQLERFAESAGSDREIVLDALRAQLGAAVPRHAILVTDIPVGSVHGAAGEHPVSAAQDCVCGWTPPHPDAAGHRLVAVMPRSTRDAWTSLLARRGIRLAGIYPRLAAAAAAPGRSKAGDLALVHIDGTTLGCFHLRHGIVRYAKFVSLSEGTDMRDACAAAAALLPRGEVFVCGRGTAGARLAAELAMVRDAILFDPCHSAPGGGAGWTAILGAARHALGAAPKGSVACVPADPACSVRPSRFGWLFAFGQHRAPAPGH